MRMIKIILCFLALQVIIFSEYKYLLKDLDKFDTITFENVIMKNIELNITMKDAVKKLIEKEISECDKEAN